MGAACKGNQPGDWAAGIFSPTPPTSGEGRLEVESMASDLIIHAYRIGDFIKIQKARVRQPPGL